jgi:carbamoyltransferase
MNVLGLKITGHDTGAALVADGRVFAIAEERLNRVKHSHNMFPRLAIDYCLVAAGCRDRDVSLVVIDQIDEPSRLPMAETFRRETGDRFAHAEVRVINHHEAHAANAFFCSPFEEAAVLVIDGAGEKFRSHLGVPLTETETLFVGRAAKLVEVHKSLHVRIAKNFPYTFGVGKLYTTITRYLGFGDYEEGKTMGLAPYGKPSILAQIPYENWCKEWHGQYLCNAKIRYPKSLAGSEAPLGDRVRFFLKTAVRSLTMSLAGRAGLAERFLEPDVFDAIKLPRPRRNKDVKLPDDYYADVAYAVQDVLEKAVSGMAKRARAVTGARHLCLSGGVGLNSVANKKIVETSGFDDLFVQPACSDTGVALGCALFGYHMVLGQPRFWTMKNAYLGRPYGADEVEATVKNYGDKVTAVKSEKVVKDTVDLIIAGKIVGWFQGGSEYGPRALGHRSIIVDPRPDQMKDTLNNRVKHRESWRPFAASVLEERANEYFDLDRPSPFMLLVCDVKPEFRDKLPAVVHVDGTCRIQTVNQEDNGIYYELIKEFADRTGVPLLLNTSYNLAGEPIIETPEDAIKDLLATNIDVLVMGDLLLRKRA